jgi:hypothetical protein
MHHRVAAAAGALRRQQVYDLPISSATMTFTRAADVTEGEAL